MKTKTWEKGFIGLLVIFVILLAFTACGDDKDGTTDGTGGGGNGGSNQGGETITSPKGIEMVYVSGGSFQMGQNGDGSTGNVTPVHTVTLTGFYMGKYEVTQEQYEAVMENNPSTFKTGVTAGEIQARRPVETVRWYDALVFCNKLSMAEGLTPAYRINNSTDPAAWGTVPTSSDAAWNAATIVSGSTGYRLPTEA